MPQNLAPRINICNYIDVPAQTSWGPRTLTDYELIYFVSGGGLYEYGDQRQKRLTVGPNQLLCIPPHEAHVIGVPVKTRFSCIHLDFNAECAAPDPAPSRLTRLELDNGVIHELFHRCAIEFNRSGSFRDQILSGMATELYWRLAEYWQRGTRPAFSPRFVAMLDYMEAHLNRTLTRHDLAREFGMSPEHVNYLFKTELGQPPSQYFNRRRICRAYRLLLEEKISVKEAADRAGFTDEYYFSRVFKKITGFPPSAIGRNGLEKSP